MKHLVVYAHPNPASFNHGILETVTQTLQKAGHEVRVRDLYTLNFQPVLSGVDFGAYQQGTVPADVKVEQEHITWADAVTFVYPVWWAGLPAILKGYVDRVFTHGFAYSVTSQGMAKLLTGKKGYLIATQGNPKEYYDAIGMTTAMEKTTDTGIFDFSGIETVEQIFFPSVPSVDDATRKGYLEQVKHLYTQPISTK